jgi:hypothetical protein
MTEKEIKDGIRLFLQPATEGQEEEVKELLVEANYYFYKIEVLLSEFCHGNKNKINDLRKAIFETLEPDKEGMSAVLVELVKAKDKRMAN